MLPAYQARLPLKEPVSVEAVIFDFDETLLDTSSLLEARGRQEWDVVLRQIGQAVPFDVRPGEIPVVDLVEAARKLGLAVGLVTHGHGPYVEALLKKFDLKFDAKITGSDGYARKPAPASLLACAKALGVDAGECCYLGDTPDDFAAAANAGMRSVGVCWDGKRPSSWRHTWPDLAVDRPSVVVDFFSGVGGLGLFAEMRVAGIEPRYGWGSIARLAPSTFAIGRYYPVKDRRHDEDPLTQLIIEAKGDGEAQERLANCFVDIPSAITENPPTIIASVPPDPEKEDRFGQVRELLAEEFGALDGGDLLRQVEGFENYKGTHRDARAQAVKGGFEATRRLDGEGVLLLDDVINTGSQTAECRRMLKQAGAGGVSVLVAGANQDALSDPCPRCGEAEGGVQVVRRSSRSGDKFLGCSNYRRTGCGWMAFPWG
jgi:phosphoglycolate phosphatase-like HAD superfamily hydrolase/ssDNA-binding Zn-finger/Zn-ribbon topoisomerase 1